MLGVCGLPTTIVLDAAGLWGVPITYSQKRIQNNQTPPHHGTAVSVICRQGQPRQHLISPAGERAAEQQMLHGGNSGSSGHYRYSGSAWALFPLSSDTCTLREAPGSLGQVGKLQKTEDQSARRWRGQGRPPMAKSTE